MHVVQRVVQRRTLPRGPSWRSPMRAAGLGCMLIALVAGCGQRGPLFLPTFAPNGTLNVPRPTVTFPLVATPLFPVVPLTSDPTASPAATSSFDTIAPANGTADDGSELVQPGLKVVPYGQ